MVNGRTKSTKNKLTGPYNKEKYKIIKEGIFISTSKNGKIKLLGGVVPSKVIYKSIPKK
jgi:hypothetical protein